MTLGSSLNLSELVSLSGKQLVVLDFRTYLRVRKDSLLKTPGIACYTLTQRRRHLEAHCHRGKATRRGGVDCSFPSVGAMQQGHPQLELRLESPNRFGCTLNTGCFLRGRDPVRPFPSPLLGRWDKPKLCRAMEFHSEAESCWLEPSTACYRLLRYRVWLSVPFATRARVAQVGQKHKHRLQASVCS